MNDRKQPKRILLIVEGTDDERFLDWLLQGAGLTDFEVQPVDGVDNCRNAITALLLRAAAIEQTKAAVAVVDADDHPDRRRASYSECLRRYAKGLRHGVYLFPDDEQRGTLEDLCFRATTDQVRRQCAAGLIECLETAGYREANPSKTQVQAYIASHRTCFRHLGHPLWVARFVSNAD